MTTSYDVAGMTCGHCERSVQEALGALEGVRGVVADHATGTVVVDADVTPDRRDVRDALDAVGYDLR